MSQVCSRIPKRVLCNVYGLSLEEDERLEEEASVLGGAAAEGAVCFLWGGVSCCWCTEVARSEYVLSPDDFIEEFAIKRGFTGKKGRVDQSQAARLILKASNRHCWC